MEERLTSIGKRMPYSLPEGFFEANEAAVMQRIAREERVAQSLTGANIRKGVAKRLPLWIAGAVAAMLAVGVLFLIPEEQAEAMPNAPLYANYEEMSEEELAHWVEFYEADLFMSYE